MLEIAYHDPRPISSSSAPHLVVAEISRLHVSIACVFAIRLRITIVETARTIIVCTIKYGIHALRLVFHCGAHSFVVPISNSWCDEHAIRRFAIQIDWRACCTSQVTIATCS